jgi:hypothetical protein
MTPQPISTRPSADSSPILTPASTPPAFLAHGFEAKMQNFLPNFDGASGSGLGRGWHDDEATKAKDTGSSASSRSKSSLINCIAIQADWFSTIIQRTATHTPILLQPIPIASPTPHIHHHAKSCGRYGKDLQFEWVQRLVCYIYGLIARDRDEIEGRTKTSCDVTYGRGGVLWDREKTL